MKSNGPLTVFLLAAVPNPLFDMAGVAAGIGAGIMSLSFPFTRGYILAQGLSAGSRTLADLLSLGIAGSAGLAVLFGIAFLLGMPEAHRAQDMIRRKIFGPSR